MLAVEDTGAAKVKSCGAFELATGADVVAEEELEAALAMVGSEGRSRAVDVAEAEEGRAIASRPSTSKRGHVTQARCSHKMFSSDRLGPIAQCFIVTLFSARV